MLNEEENCMTSCSRTSRSLSSPDSQSSFIDETEKSPKADSSSVDSSDGSTASSLKKRLRNLPSPCDDSPFGDRVANSYNRIFRKRQDFRYHLQEFSNSIKEQDENEINSITQISSIVDMRLQTPRARRRAKIQETDFSQDSSISDDLSGERLKFNEIDSEKSSSSTGEPNFDLYKNDIKAQIERNSSSMNFPINNQILSGGEKTKKIGGYRPLASLLVRNLSSESESDTNEKISDSKTKIRMLDSEFSIHSNASGINKNSHKMDGEFDEFLENFLSKHPESAYSTPRKKTNRNCDEKIISAPTSNRSNSFELIRHIGEKRSTNFFETSKNNEDNSPFSVKSSNYNRRAENNILRKEISLFEDRKKFQVPTLKLRSEDSSFSACDKNTEFQDMKALLTVLSDVSFKKENAFGDSGKFRSPYPECRGSGFSTGRNSATSPGIQIKSLETPHFKNVQGSPRNILISEHSEYSNTSHERINRKMDQSFCGLEKETADSVIKRSEEKIDEEMKISNNNEIKTNDSLFKSSGGDSNRYDQEKWAIHREIGDKKSIEIIEHYHHEPITENPSTNLFQRSARFNSMKLAKSESSALLVKQSSNDPNLSVKNCSSTSKLSFLLNSMKKETQDRCPFTISENECRNSKEDCEQIPLKEIPQEELVSKSEENFYKLDTHPSITRLALSGTEILPSELINSVSYDESTPKTKNFLPRMRNFIRRFSNRLTRKSSSSKNSSAKVLFQNVDCRFDSVASSGSQDNNNKRCSMSSNDEMLAKGHYSMQRFDSETESCRLSEIRSSRVKSSPVDIISRRNRFPNEDQQEHVDLENFFAEKMKNEIPRSRKIEEPFISDIMFETRELPCKSAVETSCFCFKMCL